MTGYESQDYGDRLADSFNLILMQKLIISLDIYHVASEHELISMRDSLEYFRNPEEKKNPLKECKRPSEIEKDISRIIREEKEKPLPEKSSFRDACECIIA